MSELHIHEKTAIATAISEIRGEMTDKEFADALGEFSQGTFHPSPTAIQKYRTGLREPSYTDLQELLHYGHNQQRISPITAQRLADFFYLTDLRRDFVELQHELYALQSQLADTQLELQRDTIPNINTGNPDNQKKTDSNKNTARSPICSSNQSVCSIPSSKDGLVKIPILIQISGYNTHNLEQNCDGYMTMPRHLLSSDDYFFLKIFGDSLLNFGIEDGDLILIRKSDTAEDGQTIVARVNGVDVYCKKYFQTAKGIILLPADHDFEPIKPENIRIFGIVEKVTRNL